MARIVLGFLACAALAACADSTAPSDLPEAPENLIVALRTTEIQLNWRDASRNEQSFRVEVSIDEGPWLLLTETPANVGVVKFPDPQPVTKYQFRVAACNAAGCSEFKEVVVSTASWSLPSIGIRSVLQVSGTAISVTLAVNSDFPVKLRMILREPGVLGEPLIREENLQEEQLRNAVTQLRYFFFGLQPGHTYVVEASVESKFGLDRTEPIQIVLIDQQVPSYQDISIINLTASSVSFQARVHPGSAPASARFVLIPENGAEITTSIINVQPELTYASAADRPFSTFSRHLLSPGTRYQWRFVVTNAYGSAPVAEGSFTTWPQ